MKKMNVIEVGSKTQHTLVLRARGRLVLVSAGSSAVVYGCGCAPENMLSSLNACTTSKKHGLRFIQA